MSDRAAVALALAVAAGAWWAAAVPLWLAIGPVLLGLGLRRPVVLVPGALLLAAALSGRAWDGLAPPPRPVHFEGEVRLVSDPEGVDGAVRVDVALGERRAEAWARGQAAEVLRPRLAGESVTVEGGLRAPPARARAWLARRHVSARLSVERAGPWREGNPPSRAANALRRALDRGAEVMSPDQRSLFLGMVVGDDRDQSVASTDRFRESGLTHLLAVSGQNVAFVLALCRPVLGWVGLRWRWALTCGVIVLFGLLTRFEPSVVRASAMAAVACTAAYLGRPASRRRVLALAVAGILLVDPLLVGSVGFQLSVAASAGIITLAPWLARRLPGPAGWTDALAVTIAAQVGVAPILVPVFGGVPVASLPANLLAVPAAGPLMMWGLLGGPVAGVVGPILAGAIHLPSRLLVGWIAGVAGWASGLPLGRLQLPHVLILGGAGAGWALVRRRRGAGPLLAAVVTAVLLAPALAPRSPLSGVRVAAGAELWRAGAVVLVLDDADPSRLLDGLHRQRVERVDVVVARRGTSPTATVVAELRSRLAVGVILAPADHRIRDGRVPPSGSTVQAGRLAIEVGPTRPRLEVEVREAGAAGP